MGEIGAAQGLDLLERLLGEGRAQAAVLPMDWSRALRAAQGAERPLFAELVREVRSQAGHDVQPPGAQAGDHHELRLRLAEAPPSERPRLAASYVRDQALRVLGIPPTQTLDLRQPLQELGLDSLMAIELKDILSRGVGSSLPATLIFDHPTVEALAAYLIDNLFAVPEPWPEPPAAAAPPQEESLLTLLASLEELSEDEAQTLLSGRVRHPEAGEWREGV